ncbi:hypothetical protein [Siccibacter turicensis]|uniref:hypothetical protein n=1 Tax=Siccibacter turicensis TaxID=357233 RepID=UPI0023EFD94A|nr:hypothetical protein [Siccibacter turicensis]
MTNYSAYLKFASDKKLNTLLSRSVKSPGQGLYDMTTDAMAGADKAAWYVSCLVPGGCKGIIFLVNELVRK